MVPSIFSCLRRLAGGESSCEAAVLARGAFCTSETSEMDLLQFRREEMFDELSSAQGLDGLTQRPPPVLG